MTFNNTEIYFCAIESGRITANASYQERQTSRHYDPRTPAGISHLIGLSCPGKGYLRDSGGLSARGKTFQPCPKQTRKFRLFPLLN